MVFAADPLDPLLELTIAAPLPPDEPLWPDEPLEPDEPLDPDDPLEPDEPPRRNNPASASDTKTIEQTHVNPSTIACRIILDITEILPKSFNTGSKWQNASGHRQRHPGAVPLPNILNVLKHPIEWFKTAQSGLTVIIDFISPANAIVAYCH